MNLEVVPSAVSGLRNGGVSITFHAKSQDADEAFKFHKLMGQTVLLDVYVKEDKL